MTDVDTSIYKNQPNPLSNLTSVLGIIGQNNQNQLFQQTYQARQAVGDAYKAAVQPDGTLDQPTLMRGLANSGFGAGEATGQGITNSTANFNLKKNQNDYIIGTLGSQVNNPNLTGKSAAGLALDVARNAGVPLQMVSPFIQDVQNDPDPASVKQKLSVFTNQALGTAGAGRVLGPPQPGTNAPTTQPLSAQTGSSTPTGLPPGVSEGAVATGTQAGALLAQHRADAANYRRQVFPLEKAIPALQSLGTTGTGPGTEDVNNIKSFLQSQGAGKILGIDPDKIKTFDEAHKYLTDWVRASGDNSTNDKLAASFSSNASTKISNAAAIDVAKSALSLRRMQQAQTLEFEQTGLPDSEYSKWSAKWNARQDPRTYGFDLMTPDQRNAVLRPMTPQKRELFLLDLDKAEKNGILSPPGSK